jgi:protease-4
LSKEVVQREKIPVYDEKGNVVTDWWGRTRQVDYLRYRADGGSYTAKEALKFGLVDEIGGLAEAVTAAAASAQISKYGVVAYKKSPSLLNSLLGGQERANGSALDPQRLSKAMTPRMWYLAPQADLAGILAAMGKE